MPVTTTSPAPYTAPSAVMDVVQRHRARGLPSPINAEVLGRAGVSESLIARTLQALQALDLIDEEGAPTAILEGLRLAPEGEFNKRLVEWLNAAYADVLQFIDPATATETDIRDAFRSYNPVGQQPRMVTLFQGLYAAAGVGSDRPQTPRPPRIVRASAPIVKRSGSHTLAKHKNAPPPPLVSGMAPGVFPPALAGLLATLPTPQRGWTKEQRDRFVNTFGAVLDYTYPVVAAITVGEDDDDTESE